MPSFSTDRLRDLLDHALLPGVAAVYLFGSRARGREHGESDVDIGVLYDRAAVPSPTERSDRASQLQTTLMEALRMARVDVVVLNDAPPELAKTVVHTGQRLICHDPEADHAFQRDAQLRYADLRPFLERTRRLKLEALAR